jgi:hypothetical protein
MTMKYIIRLVAAVALVIAGAVVGPASSSAWAVAGCVNGVCGDRTQQIAGPDGAYGEVAKARVYFRLTGSGKYAYARVWCEDRYGNDRPCRHIYVELSMVVPGLPSFTTERSVACGHSARACTTFGVSLVSGTLKDCRQQATYALAQPVNVELPHGAGDNGNRVGSYTIDTAC